MASKIVFRGTARATPGAYLTIDAGDLLPVPGGASSGMAIIGSATGGIPVTGALSLDEIESRYRVSSINSIKSKYSAGNLREIGVAVKRVASNVSPLYLIKVGTDTQASTTVSGTYGSAYTAIADNYGSLGNQISLEVVDGTDQSNYPDGKKFTITQGATSITRDNVGSDIVFKLGYDESPSGNGWDTMKATLSANGLVAFASRDEATLVADLDATPSFGAASQAVVVSSDVGDTTQYITLYGVAADGTTAQYETLLLTGTSTVTGSKTWAANGIYGAELSAACTGTVTVDDVGGADPLISIAPAATTKGMKKGGSMWVEPGTTLVVKGSGAATGKLLLFGRNSVTGVAQGETITLNGTAPVASARTDWSEITAVVLGNVDSGVTVRISAVACRLTTPSTSTVGDAALKFQAKTGFVFLDDTDAAFSATQHRFRDLTLDSIDYTASALDIKTSDQSFKKILGELLVQMEAAATGVASFEEIEFSPQEATLTFTAAVSSTFTLLGQSISAANANAAATAINNFILGDVRYLVSAAGNGSGASSVVTITALTPGGFTISESDANLALANTASTSGQNNLDGANVTPERFFTSGSDVAGTTGDFTNALELCRDLDVNSIVCLSSSSAVRSALASHLDYMAGEGRRERQGFAGVCNAAGDDVPTKTEIKAAGRFLNNNNISLVGQALSWTDTTGTDTEFLPHLSAAILAAQEIAQPLGTPTTRKNLPSAFITNLRWDTSTWDIRDDSDEMINAGLTFWEVTPLTQYRPVRHVTTWLNDDNLAFCNASVNRVVNFMARDLRDLAETVVGQPGTKATMASLKSKLQARLRRRVAEGIIVAWDQLVLSLTGDILTIGLSMSPTIDINFVDFRITLKATTLTL